MLTDADKLTVFWQVLPWGALIFTWLWMYAKYEERKERDNGKDKRLYPAK